MRLRIVSAFALLVLILAPLLEAAGCRDHCELDEHDTPCGRGPVVSAAPQLTPIEDAETIEPSCPYCRLSSQRVSLSPPRVSWGLQWFDRSARTPDAPDLLRRDRGNPISRGPPAR